VTIKYFMGLKRLKSFLKFSLLLSLSFLKLNAQIEVNFDSTIKVIYDYDLKKTVLTEKNSKDHIIFISNTNCTGCVKYFMKSKEKFTFIFLLSSESLLEVNKITKMYALKSNTVYFTTSEFIRKNIKELCQSPTPCLFYRCIDSFYFLNYNELSRVTLEFSLNTRKLIKQIDCLK